MNKKQLVDIVFDIQKYQKHYNENPTIAEREIKSAIDYVLDHHHELSMDDEVYMCFMHILFFYRKFELSNKEINSFESRIDAYSSENFEKEE